MVIHLMNHLFKYDFSYKFETLDMIDFNQYNTIVWSLCNS